MVRRALVVALTLLVILAAVWIAMRRPDIAFSTLEAAYASDESQFMTLESGLKVHYRDEGTTDGAVIVLIHGFAASLHTWEAWVDGLADNYRLISIDLPGHGLTRTPTSSSAMQNDAFIATIDEVTERLGADRFTIAGNSMGGRAAWGYALAHPDRVTGLILVNSSGWPSSRDESDDRSLVFRILSNPVARTVLRDVDSTSLVRSGLRDSFYDASFVSEDMVDRYVALSRAPGRRQAILNMRSGRPQVAEESVRAKLAQIASPTLVLHGEDDYVIPVRHGREIAAAIPSAELKIYQQSGHVLQEERSEETVADVRSFMSALTPSELMTPAE